MNTSGIRVEVGPAGISDPQGLARLGLTTEDLEALKRQGAVYTECRGKRRRYKLRFRRAGAQVVRYLRGAEEAAQVRNELDRLQAAHRAARQLSRVTEEARKALRESKAMLSPVLMREGRVFHGRAIRRTRKRQDDSSEDHGGAEPRSWPATLTG